MGEHERRHLIGRNQVIDSATRRASSFSCGDCPTYDAYPIIENDEPYPFYVGQTGSLYAYEAWNDQYGNAGQYPVDAYYSVTPSGVESINDQIGWSSVSALNGGRATVGYVYQWSQSQWDGLECIWDSGESDESFQDVVNDPTPNITQVVPSSWNAGMNTSVRVLGSGFGTNPRVTITDPSSSVSVLSVTPVNDGEVDLVIAVSAFAPSESATIMVSSNGYNGQGFFAPAGNSPMSNQLSIPIYPLQVSQSPGTLDVSTGDTSDYITVSISPSGSYSLAFSTGLASNPNSNASAT